MTRRIAFVCTDGGIPVLGPKGASIHAQAVLRVLCRAGHEVHLLTPRPGPVADHPLAREVVIHRLPRVIGDTAAAREESARQSDRRVAVELAAIQPDLVYERYSLWGRAATAWARDHAVPSILEVNAPLVEEQLTHRELADPQAAYAVARSATDAAAAVVCVSEPVAGWVRGFVPDHPSVVVLPNGVDTERIRPSIRPVRSPEDPQFTVGFLGTLKRWHGVDVLIDAMRLAQKRSARNAPARLLVVGDGPMRDELRAMAHDAGVEAHFTGAVSPDEVVNRLHRMDVACAPYPATHDHYFSPLKVFEYLAAGLPVVASAIGQIPDLLDRGRLGRLVPAGDPTALAGALLDLRADAGARQRLGAAARTAAVARHTWTAVVEQAGASAGIDLSLRAPEPLEVAG